jgi:hypothetical protein
MVAMATIVTSIDTPATIVLVAEGETQGSIAMVNLYLNRNNGEPGS